jgi:dolichyl-phosphate-mannose-protein mannosyltransferase
MRGKVGSAASARRRVPGPFGKRLAANAADGRPADVAETQPTPRLALLPLFEPRVVLALLFVLAFAVRLVHVNQAPLDFHAVRQYHTLVVARDYYYRLGGSAPKWQRELASLNRERQGKWEPEILPALTAVGYLATGGVHLWVPRVLSALLWLIGGVFLYLIARRLVPRPAEAAVASTAIFLFLPFAVTASRSMQPDPMMVAAVLASIYMILRYHDRPSTSRLIAGASVTAFAILTKGVSLFLIVPVFLFTAQATTPDLKSLARRVGLFLGLALLPAVGFYTYEIFGSGSLAGVAQGDILPQLWTHVSFWRGWTQEINSVVGYSLAAVALVGTLLFRAGVPRRVMFGLWVGYVAFGLTFTFTISTHNYWNLPLVPIVALGAGPPVALVVDAVRRMNPQRLGQAALSLILLASIAFAMDIGRPRQLDPSLTRKIKVEEEVGRLVHHTPRAVFLDGDYGLSLEYHGQISGEPWPLTSDFAWEKLAGVRPETTKQRFDDLPGKGPWDYFIVLDRDEYDQQPGLRRFLARFPLRAKSDDYLIFKLRGRRATRLAQG